MFRRFRHKLLFLLQAGVIASTAVALIAQPAAWRGILICALGASLTALLCGRIARSYLHATLGRLRRVADDLGHDRPAAIPEVQPGDDMYKLTAAVNLLATRLEAAHREEARLHAELRQRERLAFLGELAASVAHEINNPLDGVQNCARILRRSSGDPQRSAQMLDLIDGGLSRIEQITRGLLALGRENTIRPVEVRLADVIESAIDVVGPRLGGAIRLTRCFEVDDDRVLAEPALLERVFVNLLLNAIDSMPGGGELSITTRRADGLAASGSRPGGGSNRAAGLCVEVADTGAGIAPEVLPHVFEPFFTTKTGGRGTGLGLPIARRILDAHRGSISVAACAGGGTVFSVHLPAGSGGAAPSQDRAQTPL
ncbi:MAG: ATP-binding protein [Planctomycetota bacterium]